MAIIVLGVGTGVFIIALTWIVTLALAIILCRATGPTKLGIIPIFLLAVIITLVLVFFPHSGSVLHRALCAPLSGEPGVLGSTVHVAALTLPGACICQAHENTLDHEASCANLQWIASQWDGKAFHHRALLENNRSFQSFGLSDAIRACSKFLPRSTGKLGRRDVFRRTFLKTYCFNSMWRCIFNHAYF
ncbi:hypothetical protein DNTS_025142 [Danionella cerebrum]|uniref:Transmembrane protein 218 n=1 Tax=Danionella cerebrum TaxID=2873325 RepID=A0A553RLG8_9TELE|nr:hypothetical protein DNTS_025142 [Danionella translucida]TRZ03027.1 hypothetical protein DNTS_025142 [Danionella translucida]